MPDFKKHAEIAMESLKNNAMARNDDWDLFFDALARQTGYFVPAEVQMRMKFSKINFKTLMRERQRIQRNGLYLPTSEKVARKRKLYQEKYTEHYGAQQ